MFEYRVYFIDASGGIADARWLFAATDDDAITEANSLEGHLHREVWHYQRQVGSLQPCSKD